MSNTNHASAYWPPPWLTRTVRALPVCGAAGLGGVFAVWTWPVCLLALLGFGLWSRDRRGRRLGTSAAPILWPVVLAYGALSVLLFVFKGLSYSLDPEGLRLIEHGLLRFQIGLKAYTAWSVGLGVAGLLACLSVGVAGWGTGRRHLAGDTHVARALVVLIALSSLPAVCDIGLGAWTSQVLMQRYHVLIGQEETALARYLAAESIRHGWTNLDKPDIRDVRQTFRSILEDDDAHAEWVARQHSRELLAVPPVLIFRDSDRLPPPYPRKPPSDAAPALRTPEDWRAFSSLLARQEHDTVYATARAHASLSVTTRVFSEIARRTLPDAAALARPDGLIGVYLNALVAHYAELIFRPVVSKWRSDGEIAARDREERFRRLGVLFPSFNLAKKHLQAVWWKRGILERELNLRDPSQTSTEAGRMGRLIRERAAKRRRWIAEQERRWKIERARRWGTNDSQLLSPH